MSKVDIVVPAAGESVTEADIVEWKKSAGDYVQMDEALVELETDKASMDLTAEAAGILEISVEDGTVKVGDVLGHITPGNAPAGSDSAPAATPASTPPEPTPVPAPNPAPAPAQTTTASSYAAGHPSPSAAKVLAEKGVSSDSVQGTGKDGRITKSDAESASAAPAPAAETPVAAPTIARPVPGSREVRREKMSRLRKTISQRLVNAQQTAALLTTFNEVDMTEIMALRKLYKEEFKEKHEVGLGFMSFFTKAVCSALQEHPIMNAQVDGNEIVYHDFCDIGVAVSTPKGLVVPVIRNAESLSFAGIESTILGYAKKARDGAISLEDMEGGTFTITNGGVFGSMLSTPIVNAPQSAILGMHNIVQKPVVVDGEIKIRPMMYLAVSYDHRIIDGADAVRFLVGIKQRIEEPARLMIDL